MSYYDTFVAVNKSPKESYLDQMQQLVNETFDNSSTVQYDVEEETEFGSMQFQIVDARVTSLIDVKTGKKINDDMKKLIFKDLNHYPALGTRYRFSGNIWIVFDTDNIKSATSSVYIMRCNNTLNTQDKYGNIHQEPCFVDFNLMETQIFYGTTMDIPAGRIEVKCQLNSYTESIQINDRFFFGKDVYKLRTRSKPNRLKTFDKDSITLLSFYADYDNLNEDDNQDLLVTDYKNYNYLVSCQSNIKNVIDFSDVLNATVYLNGTEVDEDVLWYSSDTNLVSINEFTGEYLLQAVGNCQIICKMKNNINFYTTIDVEITKVISDNFTNKITPNVTYLSMNQTQNYEVYEYNNGLKTNTTFTIGAFDMPTKNYKITTSNNGFSITNLKYADNVLLRIVCQNNRTSENVVILIELGGMF